MQIHEIIRTRRTALGLTQEQLAGKLGVSAPAVNKWERGNSYPDITLLPVLARTLRVDPVSYTHLDVYKRQWYSKGGYRHRYLLTCSFLSHGNGPAY